MVMLYLIKEMKSLIKKRKQDSAPTPVEHQEDSDSESSSGSDMEVGNYPSVSLVVLLSLVYDNFTFVA